MNVETLLFLLLPVAAFSGWWLAQKGHSSSRSSVRSEFSAEYFTGLNFLLNEQPDKAVDIFIKMLEVDNDTVETHLALGNLFRRRGEGDRAIRIHQNLIARSTLTKEQRLEALLELGKDYMRAGFLDRSENLFLELVEDDGHQEIALGNLLDIYQQERDWEKAIDVSVKLDSINSKNSGTLTAQYCCEIAEKFYKNGENKLALKSIKRALSYDKNCVRATLLMGGIERDEKNYKAAIKSFRLVENQDATYVSEVVEPILQCYQALGKSDEARSYLTTVSNNYGGATAALALAELTRLEAGESAAAQEMLTSLGKRPSIKGVSRLIELQIAASNGETRRTLTDINSVVNRLIERQAPYRCTQCGFQGKTLHWLCPTCRHWSSIKPVQGDGNNE
ncbi:MAG: lipopolysaccharide assembly protein LapB [Thiohalomonadales bacterium]